jgi:histone acetyltransferase (RNA polymerase elongator complex component)
MIQFFLKRIGKKPKMAIEEIHAKYQKHLKTLPEFKKPLTEADIAKWTGFVKQLAHDDRPPAKPKSIANSFFLKIARELWKRGDMTQADVQRVEERMRVVRGKSHSGVLVITVFTSPTPTYTDPETGETRTQKFSCQWNCYYCPNQPGQPRSYLEGEPGVLRANQHGFDCCRQMIGRMDDLYNMGHAVDKLEVLILGGTWESYPEAYRESFIRDIYYSANVFETRGDEGEWRAAGTLDEERRRNHTASAKVIGITIETRPDTITPAALATLRRYGCTRVQIGVQHLSDEVLKKIHRGCKRTHVETAMALLKAWGFKIDAHYMPNLPGATPALDRWMLVEQLLGCEDVVYRAIPEGLKEKIGEWSVWPVKQPRIQADQWKVYPCETTPYTVIEKWFREGTYIPYPETELMPILLDMKAAVFPWIRLNRIVRDIPTDYILASGDHPNLRETLGVALKKRGQCCRCIRCREVKLKAFRADEDHGYNVYEYKSHGGTEFFIACESTDKQTLFGFVRLRLPAAEEQSPHEAFKEHAWIRELHVYGRLQKTVAEASPSFTSSPTNVAPVGCEAPATQHQGIGKTLMGLAEMIAFDIYGKHMLLVIAGEGTKGYYGKLGYAETHHGYMRKNKI